MGSGYTLVICEKPTAAQRVSAALSGGSFRSEQVEGTTVYRFSREGSDFVVCSAQGHVYGVSDPSDERAVYPVFDVEWYPSDLIVERGAGAKRRISAVRRLAADASAFVNACDFDVEGETIGYNILKYACGGKEEGALRARFSTLTDGDLIDAFGRLKPQAGDGLARAGRARHAIDFIWGANLSRALSQAALGPGRRYRTLSMGRVQGPTLSFLVQREREIREFVPVPYWKVSGVFEKDGRRLAAGYAKEKVEEKSLAERIRGECVGKEAVVKSVRRTLVRVPPPGPFNIGHLQKEAYRAFGYEPSRTLQIAERLYLGALISYPRTGSQKLPASIGYKNILKGVEGMPEYAAHAAEIMKADLKPSEGAGSDPAHPAIHPTGERPPRRVDASDASVFDLVVRRFLAAFGPSARRELVNVSLAVGDHEFRMEGGKTVFPGWMKYYGRFARHRDAEIPLLSEGDRLGVYDVAAEERFEQKPPRYSQSSLLEKMEEEGIGTKATRADIIKTVVERGYVAGRSMEVTDLGFAVVEAMDKYAPSIMSSKMTEDMEEKLEAVEGGTGEEAQLLRETVRSLANRLAELSANEEAVGGEIGPALTDAAARPFALGKCPVCGTGQLRIVRSRATKKRFVGCSNYPAGCRASAPLPQRGTVRATARVCGRCGWPLVSVVGIGRPWTFCVNPRCPARKS